MNKCKICLRPATWTNNLCTEHNKIFKFDKAINGYRLKKRKNGSYTRYTGLMYHSNEISLTKVIEKFYGSNEVVTSYHPLWAKSAKGALLEYDIFIPKKRILIEYNGIQHYQFTPIFHKNRAQLVSQQRRDRRKAKMAIKNGLTLIVFKYNEPLFEDYVIRKIEKSNI